MRILLVVPRSYHEERSRRADRTRELISGLVRADHTAEVATVKWWDQRSNTHHDRWTTHHAVGRTKLSIPRLSAELRRHEPDIVHLVDTPVAAIAASSIVGDAPIVYEATDLGTPLATRRLGQHLTGSIDQIIIPAEVVATELLANGIRSPMETVPDSIDFDLIETVTPATAVDLVWTGRTLESSNLDDLLLALAEVPDRAWQITIFLDDGVERARRLVAMYDLDDEVEVRTGATRRERIATYRGASMFVHTADDCAFATELLWAMAAGCTGIVQMTPNSSAHELVVTHSNGIRVSNPEELVDALLEADSHAPMTIDQTLAQYDVSTIIEQLHGLYQRALNQDG